MNYSYLYNMQRIFLLFLLLLSVTTSSSGQQKERYFYSINTDKGLSHHKVNVIFQDSRGFMWIGTEDGLNRYDGKYFTKYSSVISSKASLSGNIITDIIEDQDKFLWISTAEGGITRYDYRQPSSRQFKQFKHFDNDKNSIPENWINAIVDDKRGYLWLATSHSYIVRFNKKTERFDTPFRIGSSLVSTLQRDKNGIIWAGSENGGFLKINPATLTAKQLLPNASTNCLFSDSKSQIWFGSGDKSVHRYNPKTGKEILFNTRNAGKEFVDDEMQSFTEDKMHRIWMGGGNSGLIVYDPKDNKFEHYHYDPYREGVLASDHINSVYADRNGIVWIGTDNGISVYDPLFQPFDKIYLTGTDKAVSIYDFFKDTSGRLWIGTSDGIFIKPPHSDKFEHRKLTYKGVPLQVSKFYTDPDGTFYLGTDYTLFKYDREKNILSLLPNTEIDPIMKHIKNSRIISIIRDTIASHPALIVTPYGHYFTYYDFVEKRWISRADSVKKIVKSFNLKDNLIRKLYRADNGNLWVATVNYGLGDWNPKASGKIDYTLESRNTSVSLDQDDIFDLQPDNKGNIWVSTYGAGLKHYDAQTHKVSHVNESSNLSEGIQTDAGGNVWMICNGHMHKYDPGRNEYSCYEPPGLHKDGGVLGYIYKDQEGMMYAAGTNYYIAFNPDRIPRINHSPNVYLTDFKVFDSSYNELLTKDVISLNYDQKFFSIEFSAPNFSGDNIQYAYMLEGMDKKWVRSGKRNYAVYANLPAGNYVFKVKAGNWQGTFGNNVTTIRIKVLAPVWATWWFYTLVAIFILTIAIAAYRYRIRELLNRQEVRNRIAVDLHDNIGSTLSSISVYSQVAKIYQQQQNNDQLDKVLDTIGETASEMISEMGDIVWAINPKNDHMSSIYSRMESYARPVCQAKNTSLDLQFDPNVPFLKVNMNVRKNIYLIFKESINNSLKYASCKSIIVKLYLRDSMLILSIYDDGVGFDQKDYGIVEEQSLSGNGLKNMKMRAAEINAELKIFSTKNGMGTLIEMRYKIT